MRILRISAPVAASLLVAACAAVPQQQVSVSGTVPAGRSFAAVQPVKDSPPLAAWAGLEPCLGAAGLQPVGTAADASPQVLAQAAYVLRPARALVLPAGTEPPSARSKPSRKRDSEWLTLTLTDRTSGAVLWRGTVSRILGKSDTVGDGAALVAPLCTALRAAAGSGAGAGATPG